MDWLKEFWDPRNPIQKADRLRFHQRRRLVCGLAFDDSLRTLHGCLLQGHGAGKLLQLQPLVFDSVSIPSTVRQLFLDLIDPCQGLSNASQTSGTDHQRSISPDANGWNSGLALPTVLKSNCDLASFFSMRMDLNRLAENLLNGLMAKAGKAADCILAAAVCDAGVRVADADGGFHCLSLLDSDRLALRTGMNVIDQLANKDIADSGCGWPLSALPLWIIWADRRAPKAIENRIVFECAEWSCWTWLPPSDGLDAEYPKVSQQVLPGIGWLERFARQVGGQSDFLSTAAQGKVDQKLVQQWTDAIAATEVPFDRRSLNVLEKLNVLFAELANQSKSNLSDVSRSYVAWLVQQFMIWNEALTQTTIGKPTRLVLAGDSSILEFLQNQLDQQLKNIAVTSSVEHDCPVDAMPGLVAATHAFLHIDQMPANLPWITGADVPRILGRLTPGSVGRYRGLLIEMSDYRPPVMKLREAV